MLRRRTREGRASAKEVDGGATKATSRLADEVPRRYRALAAGLGDFIGGSKRVQGLKGCRLCILNHGVVQMECRGELFGIGVGRSSSRIRGTSTVWHAYAR